MASGWHLWGWWGAPSMPFFLWGGSPMKASEPGMSQRKWSLHFLQEPLKCIQHMVRDSCHAAQQLEVRRSGMFAGLGNNVDGEACRAAPPPS